MSTATRIPLAQASRLAEQLYTDLAPWCARLEVAGSIRRGAPTVGDLELVAIPKLAPQRDLFGEVSGEPLDLLEDRLAWLLAHDELAPRLTEAGQQRLGPRYKALLYQGMAVDLFITSAECWGVIYTIRTGPSSFSHRLVTSQRQRMDDGRYGLLPPHLRVREGRIVGTDGQPLDTPEEESVFAAIGLAFIAPEQRR